MADSTNPSVPSAHQDTSAATTSGEKPSTINKVLGGLKNTLHGKKEKEQPSPALQEAVRKMEERKAATVAEMQAEGKDTRALSGRKRDQLEGAPGEAQGIGAIGGVVQGLSFAS